MHPLHFRIERRIVIKKIQLDMIKEARQNALTNYSTPTIHPVGQKTSFNECFTIEDGVLILWYDVDIGCGRTTGIVVRDHRPN